MSQKFTIGETVTVRQGIFGMKMIVISADECLKGWRYKLGFPKKDGSLDKRREYRFFWEDHLKPIDDL